MNGITKSKSTKLLSALLAVLMIVAMLPTTAFAWSVEEGTKCTSTYRKHREEKRIEKNEERVNRYEERFRREEQTRSERTSSQESHSHQSATRASEPQGPSQTRSEPASKRQAVS